MAEKLHCLIDLPPREAQAALEQARAADLAACFVDLDHPQERRRLLDLLTDSQAARLMEELEGRDRTEALELMPAPRLSGVLGAMAPDELADLISELDGAAATRLLALLPGRAENLARLLRYPRHTAGGLMTTDFVSLPATMTVTQALDTFRRTAPHREAAHYIYAVDERNRLSGFRSALAARVGIGPA